MKFRSNARRPDASSRRQPDPAPMRYVLFGGLAFAMLSGVLMFVVA